MLFRSAGDARIDELEQEIQQFTVRMLALRQPVASDLRHIVAALKISSELERVGDYAANVAKRSMVLNHLPAVKPVTTGCGMNLMRLPSRAYPATRRIAPAMSVASTSPS